MLRWLPLILALASCAKDLDQLGAFPCGSANDACPDGFSCAHGRCYAPMLGGSCSLIGDVCSNVDDKANCVLTDVDDVSGYCGKLCGSDTTGCPGGQACLAPSSPCMPMDTGSGCGSAMDLDNVCVPLPDLATDPRCDSNLTCSMRDPSGTFTCVRGLCVPKCGSDADCGSDGTSQCYGDDTTSGNKGCLLTCSQSCADPHAACSSKAPVCVGRDERRDGAPCVRNEECLNSNCNDRYCSSLPSFGSCKTGFMQDDSGYCRLAPDAYQGCSLGGGDVGYPVAAALLCVLARRRRRRK